MKLLLDTCVWGQAKILLQSAGYDVIWIGDEPSDPGDEQILARADTEERVLITLDKDFGELAILHCAPHHGIVRLVDFRARDQATAIQQVLSRHGDELLAGAIVTVQPGMIRVRPAEF